MTERGALLGNRYELDAVIGRGGMAEVWKAKDNRLGRDVAVKRLRVDLASDATFQARFRREAQAAAGLNHPNIVAVYDTGEEIDPKSDVHVPFIVMELVEGVTLRDVLRDGRKVLPERALEFTQGVLDALAYSHRAGIVHRDIKPANVMLTNAGTVKVMDFGIARAVADTSATMTQTAAVIGTAQYLSPEQARGEKVDNRSDIYSTGCLLYELLVSRPPFIGDSPVSVAYQHVREIPVPPSTLDPEITPAMDAIVMKALAKDPNERYLNAKAMRDDITRALENEPVAAAAPATAVLSADAAATTLTPRTEAETTTARRAAAYVASPDAEEDEEQKKKPRALTIVLSSLALLLAVALGVGVYLMNREPQIPNVEVPAVTGLTEGAAKSTLENADFKVTVAQANSDKPVGEVIEQDPAGKTSAPKGSTVRITVSEGPAAMTIPPLTDKTLEEAKAALKEAGFTGEITSEDEDPADEPINAIAGNVLRSEPAAGDSADPADPIKLIVATGNSIVPNLNGKTTAEATKIAKAAGFTILPETVQTNDYPDGKVFEQSVADGTAASRADTIITVKVAEAFVEPSQSSTPNPPDNPGSSQSSSATPEGSPDA